jgi:UDP-glucose 4-epimerase
VIDALAKLMDKPDAVGQVFNIGSDNEIAISELARRVIAVCKSSSSVEYISYERAYGQVFDDTQRRVPNLDRIRSMIGFKPRYDLDQMIQSVKEFLSSP